MLSDVGVGGGGGWGVGRGVLGGGELASVLDVQYLFFLLKKIRFARLRNIMMSQKLIYY